MSTTNAKSDNGVNEDSIYRSSLKNIKAEMAINKKHQLRDQISALNRQLTSLKPLRQQEKILQKVVENKEAHDARKIKREPQNSET